MAQVGFSRRGAEEAKTQRVRAVVLSSQTYLKRNAKGGSAALLPSGRLFRKHRLTHLFLVS